MDPYDLKPELRKTPEGYLNKIQKKLNAVVMIHHTRKAKGYGCG